MKKRGRPPEFDKTEALLAALQVFWLKGFASTSLDDLAVAMKMNRPSIYNAFGDKESIYRHAFNQFATGTASTIETVLFSEPDVKKALQNFYAGALEVYTNGSEPLGCFIIGTATVEAPTHPLIKKDLKFVVDSIDSLLEKRLLQAVQDKQWNAQINECKTVAMLLQGLLHTIAIRARCGVPKTSLMKYYTEAINQIFK